MHPPALVSFPRICVEDCKIGKLDVPKGTVISASIMGVHYSSKYYEDPT